MKVSSEKLLYSMFSKENIPKDKKSVAINVSQAINKTLDEKLDEISQKIIEVVKKNWRYN